ncbi:aspartate carbamoyltransferase [Methanothermobacter sp. K4]|uniref:aspartate carbamoyltransferase n=1 Tax=Methanothermobacter sp. K4 TaxID=2913262 RepID=UPI001EDAFFC5|nr:aspartate carbamoyltransferase [Methanothermobacter sp. K4]MCG2827947.1 aspartate carbamoyltransferase [Methanothermobacter sp. K4]
MFENVISIKDFGKDDIEFILREAEKMEPVASGERSSSILTGKILGMMFYEPSTRTRLSFETAMKRLGGSVVGFADTGATSAAKGESLTDTAMMLAGYSDAIVIRHSLEGVARYISDIVDVPVINAGDGAGQHPTQTLLDLYTMKRFFGKIESLNVALVGDLKYGRTVHSLAYALAVFGVRMSFVSPPELRMPDSVIHDLEGSGVEVTETQRLDDVIDDVDVLYVTRIQKERFPDPEEYSRIKGAYHIDRNMVSGRELIVMHPLPRIDEISPEVDSLPQAMYFRQAFYGVPVRMALLKMLIRERSDSPE